MTDIETLFWEKMNDDQKRDFLSALWRAVETIRYEHNLYFNAGDCEKCAAVRAVNQLILEAE